MLHSLRHFIAIFTCTVALIAQATVQPATDNPTEVDTVMVRGTVTLTEVSGAILRANPAGNLTPVTSGARVQPGERLLVRRGASFRIGRTQFGPENHGDRWVQFR